MKPEEFLEGKYLDPINGMLKELPLEAVVDTSGKSGPHTMVWADSTKTAWLGFIPHWKIEGDKLLFQGDPFEETA